MDYNSEKYYQLTRPIVSDETRRARHFLVFICTLIIATYFLDINFSQIKFSGIDLSTTSPLKINITSFLILVFWNIMLILNWKRDKYDSIERSILVKEEVTRVESELKRQDDKLSEGSKVSFSNREAQLKFKNDYKMHLERMSSLTFFENILSVLNLYLPHFLSIVAAVILFFGVCK
jgi:hypothetical protein